ncbi:MAG: hypothetical protein A2017_05940 [Lentisphaerae bacterium GWF2_44_16]|nr:MAG: hypothetical protein A2017_05940 [Lentisphaerae bacterium GWF2_44_16]
MLKAPCLSAKKKARSKIRVFEKIKFARLRDEGRLSALTNIFLKFFHYGLCDHKIGISKRNITFLTLYSFIGNSKE